MKTIAILCADIHISHEPPPTYKVTVEEWYATMKKVFKELARISREEDAPIIAAGDIFDQWNTPPELINFCMRYMPEMYAVPGQHEIPYHSLKQIRKSAYWTLCRSGVISNLPAGVPTKIGRDVLAFGFPWEKKLAPLDEKYRKRRRINLAVVHAYVWQSTNTSYIGAPRQKKLSAMASTLKTYDAAVFGDNHIPFQTTIKGCHVFNCGPIFQRTVKELVNYPRVGLLKEDGSTESMDLKNISLPLISTNAQGEQEDTPTNDHMQTMMKELAKLGPTAFEFKQIIFQQLDKHPEYQAKDHPVRKIILEALVRAGSS